jgi:tellurite resistance protein
MRTFLSSPPISAFTMVMGTASLSLSWSKFGTLTAWPFAENLAQFFGILAALTFVLLFLGLLHKQIRTPELIAEEWGHPVKSSFFAAISVGLTLLSVVIFPYSRFFAEWVWFCSAGIHLLAIVVVLNAWVHRDSLEASHACPVWFIPTVGNAVIPLGGVKLGHEELSWFFFGVGLVLWFVILCVLMYRLMFVRPALPERLKPTIAIFLAPPSVAFVSWVALTQASPTQSLDPMGHILMAIAFFFALFLLTQLRFFIKLKFFMSWWAYSFPTASFATACLIYSAYIPEAIWIAYIALGFSTIVISSLWIRTLMAIQMKDPHWVD